MLAARPDLFQTIAGETHVALAVSGGSDSMALLRLAHAALIPRRVAGGVVSVLTVDHGLRTGSDAEAAQVAAVCAALGLPHHTLRWAGPYPATGLQAKARNARYDLMSAWCRANGASALLTAHTLDDQAETVLMRMGRTSSLDSLAGIPAVGQWDGLKLVRPLLGETRQHLRDYLLDLKATWIEDPSNADDRFERVRIRKALAGLQPLNIDARRLADLAAQCREAAEALDHLAADFIESALRIQPQGYGQFPAESFARLHPGVRLRVLRRVVPYLGSGILPLRAEIARAVTALEVLGTRRTLGGALVWARRSEILIAREAGRISADPVIVAAGGSVVWDGRFVVSAPPGTAVLPARLFPGQVVSDSRPFAVRQAEPVLRLLDGTVQSVEYGGAAEANATFAPARRL